jgi:type I restriction enzyme S subunit
MSLVETDIGMIAPDWKVVPLKDVAEKPQYGLTAKAAKSGDTQFLRITDITDQGVNWATVPFCSAPKKKIDTCRLKSGDIVFARIGATTGKSYMITDPPDAVFASYLIRVRAGEDLEPGFLIQFFQSRGYWQQIDANKHSNLKKGVNGSILSELLLPLPPLPEQKKIAHILSTVQRAIEAQERIIQATTELKKALMHKLFTEGLRNEPQKQTEIGPVPESWEVATVGDVTAVKGGKRLSKGDKLVENDTGFPYIRVTDFNEFSVDVRRLLFLTEEAQRPISRYIINRDDVFISIAGSIGITGMIPPELDGANLTENAARLIANDSSQLHPRFLMYWLASHHCQAEIKAQTVKNAQPKLALARIKSLKVPLPSLDEQVEVAKALDLAGRKAEFARAKRDQLQDLFRTLIHELMTAKTRIHELELPAGGQAV